MNPVTPEQLAAAHQADLDAWQAFYEYDKSLRDAKWSRLWFAWQNANQHSHELQARFDAQKLLSEQP